LQTQGGINSFKFENDITVQTFVLFEKADCSGTIKGFSTGALDNPAVESGITLQSFLITGQGDKSALREEFTAVAAGFNLVGFKLSAELLSHSLQDNPSNIDYPPTSVYSTNVKQTNAYAAERETIAAMLAKITSSTTAQGEGSFTFLKSDTDFYFALHRVSYTYSATKSGGQWLTNIKVRGIDGSNGSFHEPYVLIVDGWVIGRPADKRHIRLSHLVICGSASSCELVRIVS
jgi:hypothetical protein